MPISLLSLPAAKLSFEPGELSNWFMRKTETILLKDEAELELSSNPQMMDPAKGILGLEAKTRVLTLA